MFIAVGGPWLLFAIVYAVLCFDIRYQDPGIAWAVVGAGFLMVILSGLFACSASGRWFLAAA